MKWPPTLCWTAPKTINGNRHFQVKAYGGKNEDRWVDIFPTKNKKDIKSCLLYTSPSPRDTTASRMPSSA